MTIAIYFVAEMDSQKSSELEIHFRELLGRAIDKIDRSSDKEALFQHASLDTLFQPKDNNSTSEEDLKLLLYFRIQGPSDYILLETFIDKCDDQNLKQDFKKWKDDFIKWNDQEDVNSSPANDPAEPDGSSRSRCSSVSSCPDSQSSCCSSNTSLASIGFDKPAQEASFPSLNNSKCVSGMQSSKIEDKRQISTCRI